MANHKTEYSEAEKMYLAGLSVQDVAEFYGVSRQSMWTWLKRRGVKMRPKLKYGKENHFHRGGASARKRAIHAVEKAILKGILIRPSICQRCHHVPVPAKNRCGIEGHHADYNKPLDVMWLCRKCHFEVHAEQKSATPGST